MIKLQFDENVCGWSTQTIRRMLKNQMYIGNMVQGTYQTISHKVRKCVSVSKENYIIKEGTHEAIIDKLIFDKVQERFQHDTWQSKGISEPKNDLDTGALYVGYIKCADCGRAMQRSGRVEDGNPLYYFICGTYLQWKQCSRHATRVKKLNNIILRILQAHIEIAIEMNNLLNYIKDQPVGNPTLARLKNEISVCEMEKEKEIKFQNELYLDYKNNLLSQEQYVHFKRECAEKIAALDLRHNTLREELEHSNIENITENRFVETFTKYRNVTSLSRELIVELIEMIYVYDGGGISIEFKYQDEFEKALELIRANMDSSKLKELNLSNLTNKYAI